MRHGIMLVGPSGAGKTTIVECLAAALTELGQKTVIWRMNPKVISDHQITVLLVRCNDECANGSQCLACKVPNSPTLA